MTEAAGGPVEVPRLLTERLVLRGFEDRDLTPYHALFQDPEVTRYLPMKGEPLSLERVERAITRGREHWRGRGYGIWAVEDSSSGSLIGQCGLQFLDEVRETELLYALAPEAWGRGLATEAAGAALRFASDTVGLQRIVAYAVAENAASTRVMSKLGMRIEAEDVEIFGLTCARYAISTAG